MDDDYEEGVCNNTDCGYISKDVGDLKIWHSKYIGNEVSCFCFKCYDDRIKREEEDIITFGEEGIQHLRLEFRKEYTIKIQKEQQISKNEVKISLKELKNKLKK
jgi:hypothetical protein